MADDNILPDTVRRGVVDLLQSAAHSMLTWLIGGARRGPLATHIKGNRSLKPSW